MNYQEINPKNIYGLQPFFTAYDHAEKEKKGEQPLYRVVQHCMGHLQDVIQNINTLNESELDALEAMTQKIENWSLAKCKFYDASWEGFLKRVFSCIRNAWAFGVFRSSGEQGLVLTSMLREEIKQRRIADNIAPKEKLTNGLQKIFQSTQMQILELYGNFNNNRVESGEDDDNIYVEKEEDTIYLNSQIESSSKVNLVQTEKTKEVNLLEKKAETQNNASYLSKEDSPYKGKPITNQYHSGNQKNQTENISKTVSNNLPCHTAIKKLKFDDANEKKLVSRDSKSKDKGTNDSSQTKSRACSIDVTNPNTPRPKISEQNLPTWQTKQNTRIVETQFPEKFTSTFEEVMFRLKQNVFGESGKIYDQLDDILKNNQFIEFVAKLGHGKILEHYWLCESNEFVVCDTNEKNRRERLKIVLSNFSEEQFKKSLELDTFFIIIGDKIHHYARVAVEIFTDKQFEQICLKAESPVRLNYLFEMLKDMPSLSEVLEEKLGNLKDKDSAKLELSTQFNNERSAKLNAIISGIEKFRAITKMDIDCQKSLKGMHELFGKIAPRGKEKEFQKKFEAAMKKIPT